MHPCPFFTPSLLEMSDLSCSVCGRESLYHTWKRVFFPFSSSSGEEGGENASITLNVKSFLINLRDMDGERGACLTRCSGRRRKRRRPWPDCRLHKQRKNSIWKEEKDRTIFLSLSLVSWGGKGGNFQNNALRWIEWFFPPQAGQIYLLRHPNMCVSVASRPVLTTSTISLMHPRGISR